MRIHVSPYSSMRFPMAPGSVYLVSAKVCVFVSVPPVTVSGYCVVFLLSYVSKKQFSVVEAVQEAVFCLFVSICL